MEDRNNLDRLFKDALYDYNVEPPRYIWDDIKTGLTKRKKIKLLKYYRSIAAIAALLISFLSGYYLTNIISTNNNGILIQENSSLANTTVEKNQIENTKFADVEKNNLAEIPSLTENKNKPLLKKENNNSKEKEFNNLNAINKERVNNIKSLNKYLPNTLKNIEIEKEIIFATNEINIFPFADNFINIEPSAKIYNGFIDDLQKKNQNKWSVGGKFSPTYTVKNELDPTQTLVQNPTGIKQSNNKETPLLAYNGGLKVSYNIMNRLSIESGVYYSKYGQQINDVRIDINELAYYDGGELVSSNSYTTTSSTGEIRYNTQQETLSKSPKTVYTDTKLKQDFEYLELPLYLNYKLIDKKVDMQVKWGFSPGFLIANKVYIDQDGQKQWIGYTEGVNYINYKTSIGLGIDYPLSKRMAINLEPSVKYSLNSISLNSNIKPFSIGVFTGISYFFN